VPGVQHEEAASCGGTATVAETTGLQPAADRTRDQADDALLLADELATDLRLLGPALDREARELLEDAGSALRIAHRKLIQLAAALEAP
jgi:hypothetical protein